MEINDTPFTIKHSDGTVTGNNVPAYTNSWQMTAVKPDGTSTIRGIWNDEISFFERHGKIVLKREQHIHYNTNNSEVIQLDEADKETLMPIYLKINNKDEEPHTEIFYEGNLIRGKKIFNIEGLETIQKIALPFSYELPEPVFDWHLWGILISGFPLKEGYQAQFLAHESYSYLDGTFRWYTLNVTGQEIINGGKWGNINCWLVEVKAEVNWKIWIAVKKDIAPVQQICIYNLDETELWWKPLIAK
jgi:hypothetical protein